MIDILYVFIKRHILYQFTQLRLHNFLSFQEIKHHIFNKIKSKYILPLLISAQISTAA